MFYFPHAIIFCSLWELRLKTMMDNLATTSGTQGAVMCEPSYPPCKMARMENSRDLPVPAVTSVSLTSKQTSLHTNRRKGIHWCTRNTDTRPCLFIRCLSDHILLSTGSLIPVFCMVEQSDVPPSERKRSEHAEFVLLKKDLLFSQITEAALQELGYTHTAAALATGTHTH